MAIILPFPAGRHVDRFCVVLTPITINRITKYLVRVQNGNTPITEDVFFDDPVEALKCATTDVATLAVTHRQQIRFDNRLPQQKVNQQ